MKNSTIAVLSFAFFYQVEACLPDNSSTGIVFNDGEYVSYSKLESYGIQGKSFLREHISDSAYSQADTDLNYQSERPMFFAWLISDSFVYDPEAASDFSIKPFFSFSQDTLVINDYWALAEQPDFTCSLWVSGDTVNIAYNFDGFSRDWMPTVATTLKIGLFRISPSVVFAFKKVNMARDPQKAAYRDARNDYYASVMIPPLATYKYRAHRYPDAMVYLGYEMSGNRYKNSPRITITIDTGVINMRNEMPGLLTILIDELKFLSASGIVIPGSRTMNRLESLRSGDTLGNGVHYWTQQDSVIGLNQWYTFNKDTLVKYSSRGGCGVGTGFELPAENLLSTGAKAGRKTYNHPEMGISIRGGRLFISSLQPFNRVSLFNLLGKKVYEVKSGKSGLNAVVNLSDGLFLKSGRYVLSVGHDRRSIYDGLISF